MPTIEAINLVAGWDETPIAKIDTLSFSSGEIVVIAGPNGAGKSTTIKTIARQIKPVSGRITLDNYDLETIGHRDFAKLVAYVPQILEVSSSMIVEEVVSLGRNPHQPWWSWQASKADEQAVEFAIEKTELAALRKRAICELSGGERQRAAIAMALAQDARFILLDEPTAHLDFRHQLQLVDLLKQLKEMGIGVLLVLHDLNLTASLADRVYLLATPKTGSEPSYIARSGPPKEVFNEATLKLVYEVEVSIMQDATTGMTSYLPTRAI